MPGERILVIDGDEITAKKIELQLTEMGYKVVSTAGNSAEAIDKTRSFSPDLLIVNTGPGTEINSIETARIIMQEFHLPVILLSSRENIESPAGVLDTRPPEYAGKPQRERDLRTTISLALTQTNSGGDTAITRTGNPQYLWQVKFTCNTDGKVTRIHHGSKKTLQSLGIDNYPELFPDTHEHQIRESIIYKKPRIVFKEKKEEMLCCEYMPLTDNVVNVSISARKAVDDPDTRKYLQHEYLLDILDRLTAAVILFNEKLNIIYNNKSAQNLLNTGTCLENYCGYLTCYNPEITAELKEMAVDQKDHLLSIERDETQKSLNVLVTPLKLSLETSLNNPPTTILFAFELTDDYARVEEVLRSLYHLSPMEAKLVAQLFITPHLATAADALGITLNTARTHLKRIYSKTRVNRISSLIHLIVTGPASVILNTSN